MPSTIGPPDCSSRDLRNACRIWRSAQKTTAFFIDTCDAFVEFRRGEGATRGRLTDEEHDLRRAAIVFAGAGLDAVAKQILTDASHALITGAFLATAQGRHFLTKVNRAVRASLGDTTPEGISARADRLLLARLLMSGDALRDMCSDIAGDMTGGSFQSVERLREVCNVFGLDATSVVDSRKERLQAALEARNQIVHEMDAMLQTTRSRRARPVDQTRTYVVTLLDAAKDLLLAAEHRLARVPE